MDAGQYVLDEIHRLSSLLSAVVLKSERSMAKRSAMATLKELQIISTQLFRESGKTAQALIDDELPSIERLVVSMCAKEGIDMQAESRCSSRNEAELNILLGHIKERTNSLGLAIEAAILFVREVESKYKFQQRLWDEKQEVSTELSCSLDHLTYGSSSFTLWAELMRQDIVRSALAPGVEREFVIFGSSQGLLSLYTHVLAVYLGLHAPSLSPLSDSFNSNKITGNPTNKPDTSIGSGLASPRVVRCVGYEVLPSLWALSNFLASKHFRGQHSDHLLFHLRDMMLADVSATDVLVLTSLCWDKDTRRRVAQKLSREMKPGAVVVDYRAETFSEFGLDSNPTEDEKGEDDDQAQDQDQARGATNLSNVPAASASAAATGALHLREEQEQLRKRSPFLRAISAAAVASDMRLLSRALEIYTKESAHEAEFENFVFSGSDGGPSMRSRRVYPPTPTCDQQPLRISSADHSHVANAPVKVDTRRPAGRGSGFALRGIIEGPCSWAVKQPLYLFVRL